MSAGKVPAAEREAVMGREHSIQDIAKAAGTTSRTLRHYDGIGLLPPSRVGANGYRYYDDRALVRLQRILLLRELGLGLEAIAQVLASQDAGAAHGADPEAAEAHILASHLELLHRERDRIDAQIGAVGRTIEALRGRVREPGGAPGEARDEARDEAREEGGDLMSQNMFDGFDHTEHREEVEARWGKDAYARSDRWWRAMGDEERRAWQERTAQLAADWSAAAARGEDPTGAGAQELAARHIEWLRGVPGTPAATPGGDLAGYVRGLAEMYVADERFAANYGGRAGAELVRDALTAYLGD
ncbi:TipAS antibiotic-recognition domain-containing protein [Leucobacter sp. gxy201]|uniref:MerR family transcriptional regulator n=1 Tax=Leucobacter sp. gxy201 TaxID=2957200 RepID=UPI003DA1B888